MMSSRPTLDSKDDSSRDAGEAVKQLVAELQAGWDARDAAISNRHFAADILWGSPFGAAVDGYESLHAIHTRLKARGTGGGQSRFEIRRVLVPASDVALAHIERIAEVGPGAFSEMALYVLVRRGGQWWVAAGQNTQIRPPQE
jgi:uncharacterized protein (TIGR02246 family)